MPSNSRWICYGLDTNWYGILNFKFCCLSLIRMSTAYQLLPTGTKIIFFLNVFLFIIGTSFPSFPLFGSKVYPDFRHIPLLTITDFLPLRARRRKLLSPSVSTRPTSSTLSTAARSLSSTAP